MSQTCLEEYRRQHELYINLRVLYSNRACMVRMTEEIAQLKEEVEMHREEKSR